MRAHHAVSHFSWSCDVAPVGFFGVGFAIVSGVGELLGLAPRSACLVLVHLFERSFFWNF